MRLTKTQAWQVAQKFYTPDGKYMDLPQLGMFTPKEARVGIEQEHLIFSFKNGRVYIDLGAEEDISYRQVGRRKIAIPGLNPSKAFTWLEKIHPSVNHEAVWFDEAKTVTGDFEEWLGQYHAEAEFKQETKPTSFTPVGEVLKQKALLPS